MTPDDGAELWPLTTQDVANVVAQAGRRRKRVLDAVLYIPEADSLLLLAKPFMLLLAKKDVPELRSIPGDHLRALKLSPAGTTIKLDEYDVSIEAAGLLVYFFNDMHHRREGGLFMDLFQERWKGRPVRGSHEGE